MSMNKLIGIWLLMVGFVVAGVVLFRSTVFDPDIDTDQSPSAAESQTASSTATVTALPATPNTGVADANVVAPATPSEYPVRLIVPSANVNAGIQYVGIKVDGSMANPSNFTDVGWYKKGTVPGKIGSAVIAGHVDNALALSGVFKHLEDTKVGDDVYVTRKDGTKLHFVVDRVEVYPYKEAPNRQIFTSSDGKAHLNLVTCTGVWIKAEKSYSERLVVYTTLVE